MDVIHGTIQKIKIYKQGKFIYHNLKVIYTVKMINVYVSIWCVILI